MAATTEGLRERKKRQTREAIAHAAMALFVQHGFDAVTVADVARAADVSEKTVFNYFAAKEDLVLHGGEERRAALIEAIRTRAPGVSVRRAVPGGDARLRRPRRARPGRVDRRRSAAGRRQPLAARPALPGLGAGGGRAHPRHRRGDGRARGRPRARGRRAHAGLDAPARLPRGLQAADRRRGPARGGRRPARAGAPRLRDPRAGPRRLRRRSGPRRRPTPRPRCGAAAASRAR